MNDLPIKILILLVAGIFTHISLATNNPIIPDSMLVITSDARPLSNKAYANTIFINKATSLVIYNLDTVNEFKREISQDLPKGEKQAKAVFEARINRIGKEAFTKQTLNAYKGLMIAFKHQIRRYPVIIFNGSHAIYGVTDLKFALQTYHDWRYAQKGANHE